MTNGDYIGSGWRYTAISAVSVVVTLLGAWATHSVSREDLSKELAAQSVVINARLDSIQNVQNRKLDDLLDLKIKVERLSVEVEELKKEVRRSH